MPRAYPPPLQCVPPIEPVALGPVEQHQLAQVLGLQVLPSEVADCVGHLLGAYVATRDGARDTTRAATLSALDHIARGSLAEIGRVADDRAGVDYTTHALLQDLATAALASDTGAEERLRAAARQRRTDLEGHVRVDPPTEMLRFFCGNLRVVFNAAAAPSLERTWANCRAFALEVFAVGGLDLADFESHPDRLDGYLGTDVSS